MVLAVVLIPLAVLVILYSGWGQEAVRTRLLPALGSAGLRIELASFHLGFPLDLRLGGLRITSAGQEMVRADSVAVDIALLPLLRGTAHIGSGSLTGARYVMGAPDSALYMVINADSLLLSDASVRLRDMHITLADGAIRHGGVDMTINPDTAAADTAAAEPATMLIDVRRLALEDFTYTMRLMPVIDSLGANIGYGELRGGVIDLAGQSVTLRRFGGSRLDVAYIAPDSAAIAATPVGPESTDTTAAPWTVAIDSLAFTDSRALYTTRGIKPLPGLDFGYIAVDSLDIHVHEFYNRQATVRVPLQVSGTERCGVRLDASGLLDISEAGISFKDFNVSTPLGTSLSFGGMLGTGDMTTDPRVPLALKLDGEVSPADGRLMFPAFTPYLAAIPSHGRLKATVDVSGTSGALDINTLKLTINSVAQLRASGRLTDVMNPDRMGGNVKLGGRLVDINPMLASVLDPATAKTLHVPLTTFDGAVNMASGNISGRLKGVTEGGSVNLVGSWQSRGPDYKADLTLNRFPVRAFMPLLGVGNVTARLTADGHGLNPFSEAMRLDAALDVTQAQYQGYDYSGITARAHVADGQGALTVDSSNPNALASVKAAGNLAGGTYSWQAEVDGRHVDLHALGLSPETATLSVQVKAEMEFTPKPQQIAAKVDLASLTYTNKVGSTDISNVTARLNANDSVTNLSVHNRDFYAFMSSDNSIQGLMACADSVSAVIADEVAARTIDVARLQRAMPQFSLDVSAGPDNALTDMLSESRTSWEHLHLTASNDSTVQLEAKVLQLTSGTMRMDTVSFNMAQFRQSLLFGGAIDNRPGTLDEWAHVKLNGYLSHNQLGMQLSQRNIRGKQGYLLGLRAELSDSTATLHVYPTDPTIAYKSWTVNDDNFISWSFAHKHLDADLRMEGNGSSLALLTEHREGDYSHQEELVLRLGNVHLSDWISLNPFMPPVSGDLSADLRVSKEGESVNGSGTVTLSDFYYDRRRVGTLGADLKVTTDMAGRIRANADLSVDGVKTITLAGALNDSVSGSPLALDLSMIHFPLTAANPFIPATVGSLRGTLNGQMNISGDAADPKIDGWLQFDSTAMKVAMTGTWYPFSNVKVPVEANVVRFNGFGIRGVNDNPLTVDGTVDIRSMANPSVNLALKATNFQIVNTSRAARGADIYGKGFMSLQSTVKGNMDYMAVTAALTVLSGTNITYVMPEAANAITEQANSDMVHFVNFTDTAAVQTADSLITQEMAMRLDASLTIEQGAAISVDLSADGKNKVRLQPDGTIDMTMAPFSEPRVVGRLNIPKGFARYTPPFMSEKLFNFKEDSYISFNGDMMNPLLNIHAVDVIRANVTQSGQNSRLVDFDVLLDVTGTLNNMKVSFDLTTDDDITVANELQSMSADQRANQAMNMLLYNVYTGPGTKGDAALGGNPLYSFLASQLNTWAANNIKGVDLSFGVDQYDKTYNGSTSQTTSYSYQVSKSLFNDRFMIVVGGNYSTDANVDENFSQNLIKDISFEYFLNSAQTMYVRIFRHTGYESILEGEITQTGVGFVFKRKLTTLRRLFRRRHRRHTAQDAPAQVPAANVPDTTKTDNR